MVLVFVGLFFFTYFGVVVRRGYGSVLLYTTLARNSAAGERQKLESIGGRGGRYDLPDLRQVIGAGFLCVL